MTHPRKLIPRHQAQGPLFAGIDLGGTNIKVGIVDDLGRPLAFLSMPTEVQRGADDAARRMAAAVADAMRQAELPPGSVAGIGLGSPGTMDIKTGMLLNPPNLPGWVQFPIRDRVSQYAGLPVAFANDANAAAYGEYWIGSGRHFHSMVMFTLGTGVGGGIIVGDVSIDGEHSAGSELGHIIIDYHDDAPLCPCGHRGHLEAYGSATAVVRRTRAALDAGRASSLAQRLDAGAELSPLLLAEEAEKGDPLSLEIILETARYLGIGAASVMHTIDPSGVVFGGAMNFGGHDTALGRQFLERIRAEARQRSWPAVAEGTVIDFASLGSDAGFIGAAGIARLAHRRRG